MRWRYSGSKASLLCSIAFLGFLTMLGNQQTNSAEPSELTTTLTESSKILMAIKEITDKFPKSVSIAENIVRLAKKLGVPPIFLAETINAESGFNPAAKNPNSSATGILR
mgnify:CR=1 FL=1